MIPQQKVLRIAKEIQSEIGLETEYDFSFPGVYELTIRKQTDFAHIYFKKEGMDISLHSIVVPKSLCFFGRDNNIDKFLLKKINNIIKKNVFSKNKQSTVLKIRKKNEQC